MKSQIILALVVCGFIKQSQNCPTGSSTTSTTTTTVSTSGSTLTPSTGTVTTMSQPVSSTNTPSTGTVTTMSQPVSSTNTPSTGTVTTMSQPVSSTTNSFFTTTDPPDLECDIAEEFNETLEEFFDATFSCINETTSIGRNATVVLKKELQIEFNETCQRDDNTTAQQPAPCQTVNVKFATIKGCVVKQPAPKIAWCKRPGRTCNLANGFGKCTDVGKRNVVLILQCEKVDFNIKFLNAPNGCECK